MAESRSTSTFVNSKYKPKPHSFSYKPRPSRQERHSSSSNDKICVVCYRDVIYHSVGACEHSVCYECSARMRVLMEQNECPICRQTLEHVLFTTGIKTYAELKDKMRMFVFIPKWSIYLEDEAIQASFDKLLEHKCFLCSDQPTFSEFAALREHTQRIHQLFSCDLCVEHIKHFTKERKFYTRADLAYHKRKGDRNDTSHRGHPLCKFCDKRFFDNDELFKHLRKDHYYCHFCDADGLNHYYNTYDDLRIHYRKEHFLCEEEACAEEKFTSVFRSEIDLKAHLTSVHSRLLGKHGTKQARTLEIEFSLPKRPENERGRFGRPFGQRGRDEEHNRDRRHGRDHERGGGEESGAAAAGQEAGLMGEIHQVPSIHVQPKMDSTVDFPTLGGDVVTTSNNNGNPAGAGAQAGNANGSSLAQKMALSSGMNVRALPKWKAGMQREEEFPVLGGGAGAPAPTPQNTFGKDAGAYGRQPPVGAASGQQPKPREIDFPSLSSGRPPAVNSKVWQGSGPASKVKNAPTKGQQPNGPKAHKVAPCPVLEERSPATDFNFVPLNVSNRIGKSNGSKVTNDEFFPSDEWLDDTETEPKSSGRKGKKKGEGNQKEKDQKVLALAAAALFNGGATPSIQSKPTKIKAPEPEADFPSLPAPTARKGPTPKKVNQKGPQAPPPPRKISPPPGFQLKRNDELDEEFRIVESASASGQQKPGGSSTTSMKTEIQSKPPPGFEGQVAPCSTDVNFLDSVLQLNEISIPKNGEYRMYLQPSDMKARNERLLEAIRSSLGGDETTYDSFLKLSTLFRKNEIPAQEYYDLCSGMFGTLDFRVIFSELVVLLPDIQKQQELLVTHRNCGGKGELLSTCHICHQVLKKVDVTFHMQTHSAETDFFPSLGSSTSGRTIRQK